MKVDMDVSSPGLALPARATRQSRLVASLLLLSVTCLWMTICRAVLVTAFADWSSLSVSRWLAVFGAGLRFDLLVSTAWIIPFHTLACFTGQTGRVSRLTRWAYESCWVIGLVVPPLLAVIEVLFFNEFDSRLNYIAFEYLVYPTEVCCNIWQSYQVVPLLVGVLSLAGLSYWLVRPVLWQQLSGSWSRGRGWSSWLAWCGCFALQWLSLGMNSMQVSSHRVANECAGNGVYSFVADAWSCRFDFEHFYLTIDQSRADALLRRHLVRPEDQWHRSAANPIDRTVRQVAPQRDLNVVLILEESLGSDFVGVLADPADGPPKASLTPQLDALTREGLLFDNWFATGNRTARALEATLTSLPPIPTESILKRDHSSHVFTLAHVLEKRGYERLFMTGGRGVFDGVRSFMTSNGFNRFVEEKDYVNPVFTNAWGVSDEDLFQRGLQELDTMHASGKPFFATLLTVSNHRPYSYPDGRIKQPAAEASRANAVRYADWALGDFFRQVRSKPYFNNTVFVVMGDHGARVYGSQMFPMKSYRVPVLLMAPGASEDQAGARETTVRRTAAGTRCSTLASSIDIAPTIMGILGGDYRSTFFGRNVLSLSPEQGWAVMQHNHEVAILTCATTGDRTAGTPAGFDMTLLDARKSAWLSDYNRSTYLLSDNRMAESTHAERVIAVFQTGYRLYYGDRCFPGLPSGTDQQPPVASHQAAGPEAIELPARH